LKRAHLIQGDAGDLTSLTDTARQADIDKIGQIWREVTRLLLSLGIFPNEVTEATITLATAKREYARPADFVQMSGNSWQTRVFVNESNNYCMFEYPAPPGIDPDNQMFLDQPKASDYTGIPHFWAISNRGAFFRVSADPTSSENGLVYKYRYDTALSLTGASDTFPFIDTVQQMLIPVVAHFFKMSSEQRTSEAIMATEGFVAAVKFATLNKTRHNYGPYARS
tara:strand:+ start:1459 stop:2130 length:672 start_codon:yes stop_codon:yes gene_type:complete